MGYLHSWLFLPAFLLQKKKSSKKLVSGPFGGPWALVGLCKSHCCGAIQCCWVHLPGHLLTEQMSSGNLFWLQLRVASLVILRIESGLLFATRWACDPAP